MAEHNVLIVEDNAAQAIALEIELQKAGFCVHRAVSATHARELAEALADRLDVAILDMLLVDWPDHEGLNGADIGIEILRHTKVSPPLFLIRSAYATPEYFRAAIALGAVAYLDKDKTDAKEVLRHVRALALRRTYSLESAAASTMTDRIARTSRTAKDAMARFCQEILCEQLARLLDCPFAVLVGYDDSAYCFSGCQGTLEGLNKSYAELQQLVQGGLGQPKSVVFSWHEVRDQATQIDPEIGRRFDQGVFVPLAMRSPATVSLCLLRDANQGAASDELIALGRVLANYLQPAVLEHLLGVMLRYVEAGRRADVMSATSQFCLYVGQEQLSLLSAKRSGRAGSVEGAEVAARLRSLSEELQRVGSLLADLDRPEDEDEWNSLKEVVPMAEVIRSAWQELAETFPGNQGMLKLPDGNCQMFAVRSDLYFTATKLLQWFVRPGRSDESRACEIRATCAEEAGESRVVFEDRGRRLPPAIRDRLFVPFAQRLPDSPPKAERHLATEHMPLYLAKMLVELRNDGRLEDRTHEMPGDSGHRFVLSFRTPSGRVS